MMDTQFSKNSKANTDKHYFNIAVAELYGVNCALILNHIEYWVRENEKTGTHCIDGLAWTYASVAELRDKFTYLSTKQIDTAINTLRQKEIILVKQLSQNAWDHTRWFTLSDKGRELVGAREIDLPSRGNRFPPQSKSNNNNQHNNNNNKSTRACEGSGQASPPSTDLDHIF